MKLLRFTKSAGYYYQGDTAGFDDDTAARYVKSGHAVYAAPPASGEEEQTAPPSPPAETPDPPAPAGNETQPEPPAAPSDAPPVPPPAMETTPVEPPADPAEGETLGVIPEDWQNLHGNTRKKFAKLISGNPVGSLEEADAIIAAEVQRRAAAQ